MSGTVFVLPTGLSVVSGTGITTYSGLYTTSTTQFLNRSDLGDQVPNFMALCEEEFNRRFRVPDMEEINTLATTAGDETVALPDEFLQAKELHFVSGSTVYQLQQLSLSELRHKWDYQGATGTPVDYAISGGQIYLGPVPDAAYSLQLTSWQAITPLSLNNETNWVSLNHPSAYLMGILYWAEFYGWNDERAVGIEERWYAIMERVAHHGRKKRISGSPRRLSMDTAGTPFNILTG